ncbi:MAG TPA: Nramp family divalent metal transporter [Patescibacteria group bacterium]|nr:Nramp family divalent metal transporter [Patescibacteria group bacterium]
MNWPTITDRIRAARRQPQAEPGLRQRLRTWRRRLGVFLAVLGPGLITSNVDNDAGGIATYSQAGAQFGYALLWTLLPLTLLLYIGEEMCARMGVATGKGLSDLIREEFGFRSTFFVMLAGLLVDLGNTIAEFAGVAAGAGVFGVSKYIAVPLAALLVWVLVVRGTYSRVEKVFLAACAFYVAYVLSALFAKPDWTTAVHQTLVPSFHFTTPYLVMLIGLVGTTVAPWQFFYLQAGEVEKRIGPRQYRHARTDVLLGSITSMAVVFFIIVCTAATLHVAGITNITNAGQAAMALKPLAGRWAAGLFAFGLLNASLFSASVLPLSTAHVICEGLGFEAGIDQKVSEAPIFYGLYTGLIVVGAGIILIPKAPLFKILLLSQVANGVWLPVVLIFILLLINRKDLMGELTNGPVFNFIAWTTSVVMVIVTLIWIYLSVVQPGASPGLLLLP